MRIGDGVLAHRRPIKAIVRIDDGVPAHRGRIGAVVRIDGGVLAHPVPRLYPGNVRFTRETSRVKRQIPRYTSETDSPK